MPTYEYTCSKCGEGFERRLRIDERLAKQECPACGRVEAVFHMSAPAIVGSAASAGPAGVCPTSGQACGCGHALHN